MKKKMQAKSNDNSLEGQTYLHKATLSVKHKFGYKKPFEFP